MSAITVRHHEGDRFVISARGHSFLVDQPTESGGTDIAPTPTELFVASLASCVAHYAHRYLARHDLPTEGLVVTASYGMELRPARVGKIDLEIELPAGVPEERRDALLAVASHCTVHNTLEDPPDIKVAYAAEVAAV
ncbi:MAG TPA: OsmC family protein [Mycobacteriales bacterium]|nr:OsmC family protein [Mycobacteriales bacterium]